MNNMVLVKMEEKRVKTFSDVIEGKEERKFTVYYVEFEGVKIYLDLPIKLRSLVSLGGDLWIYWDKVAKYATNNRTFNWNVAPSQYNNQLFEYLFAKQMEMDFEGGEED